MLKHLDVLWNHSGNKSASPKNDSRLSTGIIGNESIKKDILRDAWDLGMYISLTHEIPEEAVVDNDLKFEFEVALEVFKIYPIRSHLDLVLAMGVLNPFRVHSGRSLPLIKTIASDAKARSLQGELRDHDSCLQARSKGYMIFLEEIVAYVSRELQIPINEATQLVAKRNRHSDHPRMTELNELDIPVELFSNASFFALGLQANRFLRRQGG